MAKTELHIRKTNRTLNSKLKGITYRNRQFYKTLIGKDIEGSSQNTEKFKPPSEWAGLIDSEGNMLTSKVKEDTIAMIKKAEGYEKKLNNIKKYLDFLEKDQNATSSSKRKEK